MIFYCITCLCCLYYYITTLLCETIMMVMMKVLLALTKKQKLMKFSMMMFDVSGTRSLSRGDSFDAPNFLTLSFQLLYVRNGIQFVIKLSSNNGLLFFQTKNFVIITPTKTRIKMSLFTYLMSRNKHKEYE